jgi:hypothetical protein
LSVQCAMSVVSSRFTDHVDLGVLTRSVPPELVDEVIDEVGCREQRRRLLPARVVVYLVLALCLFRGSDGFVAPGYRAVLRLLVRRLSALIGVVRVSSASAVAQARERIGDKPFVALFQRVAGARSSGQAPWSHALGLLLVAWDATTLAVPDSPTNAAAFGYHGHRAGTPAAAPAGRTRGGAAAGATPLVRLMMLVECGTHAIIDAVFAGVGGADPASEQVLARRLLASLRCGTLLLADRNFAGYDLWGLAAATGAQLLWRLKHNVIMMPERILPDGSYLARMPTPAETRHLAGLRRRGRPAQPTTGHLVRIITYTVTITTTDGERTEHFRLATTLLDPEHAPAHTLATLYHQRWESETSYSKLKPRLIGRDGVLRSHTPTGVSQEIYALLVVYQALCDLAQTAAATAHLDPDHISFTVTIRAVRAHLTNQLHTPPTDHDHHHVIAEILDDTLPQRRNRTSPHQRRPTPGKYQTKRRDRPRPTRQTSYTLQLTPPPAQTP